VGRVVTQDFDIIVVGAGILGLSSACHLQRANPEKRILVIDRLPKEAQANSGRSAAMFRNTFTSADNRRLADTSIDFYLHVQRDLGVDLGIELIGYLWLISEDKIDHMQPYIGKMVDHGIDLQEYTVAELAELLPQLTRRFDEDDEEAQALKLANVGGALLGKKCGSLDSDLLAAFYLNDFLSHGGCVSFRTNATQLVIEPPEKLDEPGEPFVWQDAEIVGVQVVGHRQGELRADTIVLATGAWANELLDPRGIDGRVKAKKRQLFNISVGQNRELARLLYNPSFNAEGILPFVVLPKYGVYLKPLKAARSFWIGCEDEISREFIYLPDASLDTYTAEKRYYEYNIHPVLSKYLPPFKDVRPASKWAGLYAINTLDYLPYVFTACGAIVVCGVSGSGIMKADALGRIVSAVYEDGEDACASLYPETPYEAKRLGYRHRNVEREEWVI
jgi:glycine/D-amino acid oxidase-like deaminating enzyme